MAAPADAAQTVAFGNSFVRQYYSCPPAHLYRYYKDVSQLGRSEDDGSMSITSTVPAIHEKLLLLNYDESRTEIKSVDSQVSFNYEGAVHVLVTGSLTGKDNMARDFVQSFFLVPQSPYEPYHFVLNDMFRYVDKVNNNHNDEQALVKDVEALMINPGQDSQKAGPAQNEEQTNVSPDLDWEHIDMEFDALSLGSASSPREEIKP